MPKKILFESAVHQLAAAGTRRLKVLAESGRDTAGLRAFLRSLDLRQTDSRRMRATWMLPTKGSCDIDFTGARFYQRGDSPVTAGRQANGQSPEGDDATERHNREFFDEK